MSTFLHRLVACLLAYMAGTMFGISLWNIVGDSQARPEPPATVTASDLCLVKILTWNGGHYPFSLTRDGRYWCGPRDGVGTCTWGGDWRLDSGVLILREASFTTAAYNLPERQSEYREVQLKLTRRDNVITGNGWNHTVKLDR